MLKVGLIGAGAIGNTHLLGFENNNKCQIVAIASRTEEHAKAAAEKFQIAKIYIGDNWKEMLRKEDLDIVSICTPNYLHAPMILEAIENNIHILCEKPICISKEELIEVENKLKNKKIIFFTAFQKRYISIFPLIKEIIKNNILGKIILTRYLLTHYGPYKSWKASSKEKWFFDSKKAGGGVLLDLGVHCIDLLRYLIDDYVKVNGFNFNTSCINLTYEDSCNVIFQFKNDVLGIISVSWCNVPSEIIEIFGTQGSLKIDLFAKKLFSFTPKKLKINPLIKSVIKSKLSRDVPHHSLINHFITCVLKKKQENPNFEDGKKAVEFVLNAYSLKY